MFIMKTEHQERLGVAPPSAPSILQTNVKIARPQRSNHPARRRVENRLEWKKAVRLSSFSGESAHEAVCAGWLSLPECREAPPSRQADKIRGQFN